MHFIDVFAQSIFMRKFLACVVLILCLFCASPVFAADFTAEEYVMSLPNTEDAVCLSWGQYCAVGVRTKGILLKSQNEKYLADIRETICKMSPQTTEVYVTTDVREIVAMKEIKKMLADGKSPLSVYNYVAKKYPWLLDKLSARAYNDGR